MMKLLFLFVCAFAAQLILTLDVTPEKLEVESRNNKYIHSIVFTFRRKTRHSPYYINFDYYATCGIGNNLTMKWSLYENISGRYVLIPVQFEYKLCDFLYKDQFLGKMYAQQLHENWSCPFPSGRSVFRNLVMHVENIPLIPFTYSSLIVRVRADLSLVLAQEEVALVRIYSKVTQKLKKS